MRFAFPPYEPATKLAPAKIDSPRIGAGIAGYVAINDGFSIIDVQAKHCSTGKFKVHLDQEMSPTKPFSVQYMRGS